MRTPRIILDDRACAYHCISRVVGQQKLFTDAIKEKIQEIIINAAHLHGIHLINWTILSNHIHILVVVPGSDLKVPLSKSSLLKAVKALYSESYLTDLKQQFKRAEKLDAAAEGQLAVQRILDRYETNRGNLSEFMKEVKQRTSLYVNKRLKRYGTLWDGRFKSPIVENTAEAILAVSTYIDLNSVRAGITDRPENYRWCGYAAALAGNPVAKRGLASIYAICQGNSRIPSWASVRADYRQYLFEKGLEVLADDTSGSKGRRGFSAAEVEQTIRENGVMPLHEVICHRVRYFSDGVVIGSAGFVEQVFQTHRKRLVSPDSMRNTGARTMRGADWGGLTTLRDLRINVIGHPN